MGIHGYGVVVARIDGGDGKVGQAFQACYEVAAVGATWGEYPHRSITGKESLIIWGVETDRIAGVTGSVKDPALSVADSECLNAPQLFAAPDLSICVDARVVAPDYGINAADMVEVIVCDYYLLYRSFPHTGIYLFDFIDNRTIGTDIDQGVDILDPVPFSENKVRTARVGFGTAIKGNNLH